MLIDLRLQDKYWASKPFRHRGELRRAIGASRSVGRSCDVMHNGRLIIRHAILSILFVVLFLALNHPSVILISQLGSVAWYPATGLVLALLAGNQSLVCRCWSAVADALAACCSITSPSLPSARPSEICGRCGVATALPPTFCAARCELIWDCAAVRM